MRDGFFYSRLSCCVAVVISISSLLQAVDKRGLEEEVGVSSKRLCLDPDKNLHILNFPDEVLLKILTLASFSPNGNQTTYFDSNGGCENNTLGSRLPPFCYESTSVANILKTCQKFKALGMEVLKTKRTLKIDLTAVSEKTPCPPNLKDVRNIAFSFENEVKHPANKLMDLGFLKFRKLQKIIIEHLPEEESFEFLSFFHRLLKEHGVNQIFELETWADMTSVRNIEETRATLLTCKNLRKLCFKYNSILARKVHDDQQMKACKELGDMIRSLPLKSLEFFEEEEGEEENHTSFFHMQNCFPKRLCHLRVNGSDSLIQEAFIFQLRHLQTLELKNTILSEEQIDNLKNMTSLQALTISMCSTVNDEIFGLTLSRLSSILPPHLQKFDFSGNLLKKGAPIPTEPIFPKHLTHLDLAGSIEDDETLGALETCITHMTTLNVSSNGYSDDSDGLSADGINHFLKNASMPAMRKLIIGQSYLSFDSVKDGLIFALAHKKERTPKLTHIGMRKFKDKNAQRSVLENFIQLGWGVSISD